MVWIQFALLIAAIVVTASEDVPSNGSARIVGGVETNFKQQPFVVEVLFRDRSHLGAATMIAPRMGLTAAQVTFKLKASDIRIRVNGEKSSHEHRSHESKSHERNSHEKDDSLFEVLKIIEHTCYDPLTQDNDISILKLLEPIRLRFYPKLPTFLEEPKEKTAVAISGWGVRENLQADYSRKLRTVVVQISDFVECSAYYRQFTTPRMFCVSTTGKKDSCQGNPLRFRHNILHSNYLLDFRRSRCTRPFGCW